jgi:hypothetical protein
VKGAGIAALLFWLGLPAVAHDMNLARYLLERDPADGSVRLELQLPAAMIGPGELIWPETCTPGPARRQDVGTRTHLTFPATCREPFAADDVVISPWGVDGALFMTRLPSGERITRVIGGGLDSIRLPVGLARGGARPLGETVREYTTLGIGHILEGLDHLAFVLCLFLVAAGRVLLALVTAFTLGHSLSLALAYLGVVTLPGPPVEAVIALSIVFMARESVLRRGGPLTGHRRTLRYAAVIGAFGVLHGLGFASVLAGLGVSPGERIAGLLSFNLGVEIGQLLFVGGLLLLGLGLRSAELSRPAARVAPVIAGLAGAFWFAQRVHGFAGL